MTNDKGKVLTRANPETIHDKFLVGYQGWFTCPGDGEPIGRGHHGWLHWFNKPIPDGGRPNTDLWPDVSDYSPSELYPAPGLKYANGDQAFLFSSRHPKTVKRHFNWMALHGIDGAFLQRFAGQCDLEAGNESIRRIRDEVGDRIREAAEQEGRVFAIMYDVTGVSPDRIQRVLENDWTHLIRDKCILDSPNYLKEQGKPVIALWGFGFHNRNHSPQSLRETIAFLRSATPGGAYMIAGAPAHWRNLAGDADRNPEFLDIWLNDFDAISPWTVGRYSNEDEADRWAEQKIKTDAEFLRKRAEDGGKKVDYIPVVLPGGSGYNLSQGKWNFNGIKRNGGRFLWKQIYNARHHGVRTLYGAMWDEYDEGTAYMPVVSNKAMIPVHETYQFMALDEDGFDLPPDWYMRICGLAAEGLRSERVILDTFPVKELQDYWSTRPRYEDTQQSDDDDGGGNSHRRYQEWLAKEGGNDSKEDPPPPPYTLEAETPASSSQDQPVSQDPQPQSAQTRAPRPNLSSRPSMVAAAPPSVDLCSRPSVVVPAGYTRPAPNIPQDVSALADGFSQHSISSTQAPQSPSSPTRPQASMATPIPVPIVLSPGIHPEMSQPDLWPPQEWQNHMRPQVPPCFHPSHRISSSLCYSLPGISPPPAPPLMTRPSLSESRLSGVRPGGFPQPQAPAALYPSHASTSHPHQNFPIQHSTYDPHAVSGSGHQFPQVNVPQYQQLPYEPYQSSYQHPSPSPGEMMPQSSGLGMHAPHLPPGGKYGSPPPTRPMIPPSSPFMAPPPRMNSFSPSNGDLAQRALGVVDRFAGQDTRQHLERGLDVLAQTGSRLRKKYNPF